MRIVLKDLLKLFQNMQEDINISNVSIVIFAAVDIDSICTLKMLSKLYHQEQIQYKIYPVTTYSELGLRIEEARVYQQVKMFMFINCGGLTDLTEHWITQQKQAQIFLFDTNKPIHHKNLQSNDIKIVDDGLSQYEYCPSTEEIERFEELNDYQLNQDQEEDEEENSIQEKVEGSPKRMKKRDFKEKLRKHKELIQSKINSYYGQHFFSYPSSYSAFRMIKDLQKMNNQFLWYAIVGMTSMYLERKISREVLQSLTETYRSEVSRFNVAGSKKGKGDISVKKGFQFTLLDHWSLYQSMRYSNYLMIKLHLWDQRGLKRLNEFIHHLEISLKEASQKFKFIPQASQLKLQNNIIPIAEKFNLTDLVFISFVKQLDYVDSVMASDYYHILTTILEAPPKEQIPFEKLNQHRIKCFWEAYDSFEWNMNQLVPKIEDCCRNSRILMNEAKNILERDHLIQMKLFSVANIRNDTDDKKIFSHPSTLMRLAYTLMGILKEKKRSKHFKPFIANWIDLQRQICMIVGVMMEGRNTIGTQFNDIAAKLNIQVNQDYFMANIIVIKKENLSEFIKEIGQS